MYVAPALRNEVHYHITNLCDEFLHIDDTPEAKISECCAACNSCIRKSVTCIAILRKASDPIYSCIYKNKTVEDNVAIHAEMFVIGDSKLRSHLDKDQVLTLYLTFQPCHFSGGHHKMSALSCTEALQQFYQKTLSPLNTKLVIKVAYIYRAHWIKAPGRYFPMIANARTGLKLLKSFAEIKIIDETDYNTLYHFCDEKNKKAWDDGEFDDLLNHRMELIFFMNNFISGC